MEPNVECYFADVIIFHDRQAKRNMQEFLLKVGPLSICKRPNFGPAVGAVRWRSINCPALSGDFLPARFLAPSR